MSSAGFLERLISAGYLHQLGPEGLYGRSRSFEVIAGAIERLFADANPEQVQASLRFPPLLPTTTLERTGYPLSFPNLIGIVDAIRPDDASHARLLAAFESGEDWTADLSPAGLALCSAACHPLYPLLSGQSLTAGRVFEVLGHCFRNEPSLEPTRMQCFRQLEFVYVGLEDGAQAHRDQWAERARGLFTDLGVPCRLEIANDPFFGRTGKLLAGSQRRESLKLEIVTTMGDGPIDVAISSANCHRKHFGEAFQIDTAEGPAHTSCLGVGLERATLALLWHHGLVVETWPSDIRNLLRV